jgi:recombination protein RecT
MQENNTPAVIGDDAQAAAVRPLDATAKMVAAYGKRLLNSDRAQQFVTQLSIMARNDKKIADSTPESIGAALVACMHLNLMPNTPEGLAYIIPYKNNRTNRYEAQFQVGYKGLIQLAYNSGMITGINAELVFPQDDFEVDLGSRKLRHIPDLTIDRTKYSAAVAAYAIASLPNGGQVFEVLSRSEVAKIKNVVKAKSTDTPWNQWEEVMVKKTVIKRLTKVLPQSSEKDLLQRAANYDSLSQAGKLKLDAEGEIVQDQIEAPPAMSEAQREKLAGEAKTIAARRKAEAEAEEGDAGEEPATKSGGDN